MATSPPRVNVMRERLSLPVPGGVLAITKLQPANVSVFRGIVIVNCAMSVKQSFYRAFAQFLASLGYLVVTWDYRGVGESALDPKAAALVSLDHWARDDFTLVIQTAAALDREAPVFIVGHSFGGQIIGLPENRDRIRGALLVACPSGYAGHWKGRARGSFMRALAYLGLPVLTRLVGHFPASRLGLGANLPRRVALQWGQWLRHPRYVAGCVERSARIASFEAPIHAISFTDDEFAPPNAVKAMLLLYSGSKVTAETIAPVEQGREHIGHMGFFRPHPSNALWQHAASHIEALTPKRRESNDAASEISASAETRETRPSACRSP